MSFRTLNGLAAGTALLVVMGALKLLESRSRRDDAIVIGVALFLLLAAALAGQALWRVPFYLLAAVGRLRRHRAGRARATQLTTRAALRLAARALRHGDAAGAGVFRVLSARRRTVLGAAAGVAARPPACPTRCRRAASASSPPNTTRRSACASKARRRRAPRLYWRGPVLNDFDGFTWRRERVPRVYRATRCTPRARRCATASRSSPPTSAGCSRSTPSTPVRGATCSCRTIGSSRRRARSPVSPATTRCRISQTRSDARAVDARAPLRDAPAAGSQSARAGAGARDARPRRQRRRATRATCSTGSATNGLEYTLEPGATSIDSVDTTLFDTQARLLRPLRLGLRRR